MYVSMQPYRKERGKATSDQTCRVPVTMCFTDRDS